MEELVDLTKIKRIPRSNLPMWLIHIGMLRAPGEYERHYALGHS